MTKYCVIALFAAIFLIACENNTESKNDSAPQNDEAATADDDRIDPSDQSDPADLADGDSLLSDGVLPDETAPDDTQSDSAQPDETQIDGAIPDGTLPDDTFPDNTPSDDTVSDGSAPDDALPDDAQPDNTPTDDGTPDIDAVVYPTTSSISYNKVVEPWSGGANILEGNAVIVDIVGQPPAVFTAPDDFVGSKSFIDVSIYREDHSTEFVRVRFSRAEVEATELPVTILLQPPLMMKSLKTISQAEWFDGEMVNGFLTGTLTITGFNEGEAPGSPVILTFSGDDLTFTPTN